MHIEVCEFLDPYLDYLTTSKVEECSAKYEIHPAVILGQLAHDKKISYRNQRLYNENVLEQIDADFIIKYS